ncbi:3'-5'-exoribonuclease family protein [Actinidia rufa]|uniref:Ribosomal RNA-processing protein 42 n=1 Tax=Actinidia rufa TaxID=165716 RepID=A0A7J0G367_9ERIC|nr:3'-5'-exoribonuclease family protein [Actinidia rufa]
MKREISYTIASQSQWGGEELSAELSAALQRSLLGGKSGTGAGIDLSSLSIVEGKICWDLYIDGLVVSSDGNLLDALGAAIKAALSNTGIHKVNVASSASSDEQTEVGRHYIVDATSEEESQMSSALSVSINRQGRLCGLTKHGGAGLDPSVILDMISVAKHVSEQLLNNLANNCCNQDKYLEALVLTFATHKVCDVTRNKAVDYS